jgi:signal transduction histidine kinase
VENSWEALGKSGGIIHLEVRTVAAADIDPGLAFPLAWQPQAHTYGVLEVRDQGCGIAAADIEKIFDPFFTGKFMGRGMGLALVLGILRAHDGCITVASHPGGTQPSRSISLFMTETAPAEITSANSGLHLYVQQVSIQKRDNFVLNRGAPANEPAGFVRYEVKVRSNQSRASA